MKWRNSIWFFASALIVVATLGMDSPNDTGNTFLPFVAGNRVTQPTPTSTLAPTATATTQPTPTATATTAPTGVTVLGNHTTYTDSIDALHIFGEVVNNTGLNVEFVKITANLFDSSGQLVDTDIGYTDLDVLPPGERTCFEVLFFPGPGNWASYQFEVDAPSGGDPVSDLVVTQHNGSYNVLGWYEIVGMIRNDNSQSAEYVKAIGTIYDSSGRVIDCGTAYVSADTLAPGQSSSFKMYSLSATDGRVGSYRLQTDGMLQ